MFFVFNFFNSIVAAIVAFLIKLKILKNVYFPNLIVKKSSFSINELIKNQVSHSFFYNKSGYLPRAHLLTKKYQICNLISPEYIKLHLLRKNLIFNKSRYSRNKQNYRTGVFLCIWLTILTVLGLYFYFYIFLIKFTYVFIFIFIFIFSFFLKIFLKKDEKH